MYNIKIGGIKVQIQESIYIILVIVAFLVGYILHILKSKYENEKVTYIINVNSIVYGVIFLLILISVIYFISKGIGEPQIIMQSTGDYTQDQINTIQNVASNVTGKINNIIAVSAIFFAVVVSSVSVFQFIKVKDFDKEINDLFGNIKNLNNELIISNNDLEKVKDEIWKVRDEKNKLEFSNVKTQLEFNIYKINQEFYKNGSRTDKIMQLINDSIRLALEYEGAIDDLEISKLYYKKAIVFYDLNMVTEAITESNLAMDKVKDKFLDMDAVSDLNDMDYIENLARLMIKIYRHLNQEESITNVISEFKPIIDCQINDILQFLSYAPVSQAIETIKQNIEIYQDYFLDKFKEKYINGKYEEFNNDKDFLELIEKLKLK